MKKYRITKEDFVQVVEESMELLFRLSYSILKNKPDAEDAVAEALLKAWERRWQVKENDNLKNWLTAIVINNAKSMCARRQYVLPITPQMLLALEHSSNNVEVKKVDIWSFLTEMKEKHKTVLLLYYYADYPVEEIAEILHVPEGTVKSRLSRAREELKQLLIQDGYRTETSSQKIRQKGQGEKGHGEKGHGEKE